MCTGGGVLDYFSWQNTGLISLRHEFDSRIEHYVFYKKT